MNVNIRLVENITEDAEKIKAIDELTFNDCSYTKEEIVKIIESGKQIIMLAEVDDKAIGFASLMEVQTLHYHGFWIDLLAVIPDFEGVGIGNKLIECAYNYSVENKAEFVSALVRNDNLSSLKCFSKSSFNSEGDFKLLIKGN